MSKTLKFQSTIESKINGTPHSFNSNELLITKTEITPKRPTIERKSIPYRKPDKPKNNNSCKSIGQLLLAILLKIFN